MIIFHCCFDFSSYLNSDLWEVDLHGQLLSAVHIRVVRLLEGSLQLVQLVSGEGGSVTPVFLLVWREWSSETVTTGDPLAHAHADDTTLLVAVLSLVEPVSRHCQGRVTRITAVLAWNKAFRYYHYDIA